jgi:pyrrolysine biosynthesis protein PylD
MEGEEMKGRRWLGVLLVFILSLCLLAGCAGSETDKDSAGNSIKIGGSSTLAPILAQCADNGEATGKGFVTALNGMAQGIQGKEALVLGAGPVGASAIASLKSLGAKASVFDIDETKVEKFKDDTSIKLESALKRALAAYRYIIDATPQGGFIQLDDVHPDTKIACPGMPLGLSPTAYPSLKSGLIHDPLQIGVATMLTMALL